jgi:hypothetical protein
VGSNLFYDSAETSQIASIYNIFVKSSWETAVVRLRAEEGCEARRAVEGARRWRAGLGRGLVSNF